tara:strand:+ start:938 stop:1171 length:234 start_codon:yes stop_codon:yes gene_type:complete
MSNRSEAAYRAAATRRARKDFTEHYGQETAQIVQMISQGYETPEIAETVEVRPSTVAAYRANVTRGTYGTALTSCNW